MKLAWLFLLTLVVFSCEKPNPLDAHIGVWAVTRGSSREINSKDFFYLVVDREQIENKNITLVGTKITIQHAELCTPFLRGKQEFNFLIWNDTMLYTAPVIPLPRLHSNHPDKSNTPLILMKCNSISFIKPKSIGIMSFVLDSISPINYMIDIENGTTAYLQYFNHEDHSSSNVVPNSSLKSRKLAPDEKKIYTELLKYTKFDTLYNSDYGRGCIFGSYFIIAGFQFQEKNYPMKYHGNKNQNSNIALQGFLFTIAKRGNWQSVKGKRNFSAQMENYHSRQNQPKSIAFVPQAK